MLFRQDAKFECLVSKSKLTVRLTAAAAFAQLFVAALAS